MHSPIIIDYIDIFPGTKLIEQRPLKEVMDELIRLRKSLHCTFLVPDHRTGELKELKFE